MTLATSNTPDGGEPKDFISVICPLVKQSTASLAYLRAGNAFANSFSALLDKSSASFDATLVLSSSSLAIFYSSSAIADSLPTFSIKTSVSLLFLSTSTILIFNSAYKIYTLD